MKQITSKQCIVEDMQELPGGATVEQTIYKLDVLDGVSKALGSDEKKNRPQGYKIAGLGRLTMIIWNARAKQNLRNIKRSARRRGPKEVKVGQLRRVNISDVVTQRANSNTGVLISGIPGYSVKDVKINNIRYEGGGSSSPRKVCLGR